MPKNCFISIIIPVFNEEDCIEKTLDRIVEYMSKKEFSYEIIVADDGSTDKTKDVVEKVAQKYKDVDIKFISKGVHKGKGFAVSIGMKNASGDYALFLDADLSTDISEIDKFLDYIKKYEIVISSRALKNSKILIHQPFYRELGGKLFNKFIKLVLGLPYNDTQCGAKMFRREAAKKIFSNINITGFSFDIEVLLLAKIYNYKVIEIPVVWKHSFDTKIKFLKDGLKMVIDVVKIKYNYLKGKYK